MKILVISVITINKLVYFTHSSKPIFISKYYKFRFKNPSAQIKCTHLFCVFKKINKEVGCGGIQGNIREIL